MNNHPGPRDHRSRLSPHRSPQPGSPPPPPARPAPPAAPSGPGLPPPHAVPAPPGSGPANAPRAPDPTPAAPGRTTRAAPPGHAVRPHPGPTPPTAPPRAPAVPSDSTTATDGACSSTTCAFVPLIPNDDTPARRGRPDLRPLPLLGQQLHRTRRPVHLGDRLSHMQSPRQHTVPQRHHHLDDPRRHRQQPVYDRCSTSASRARAAGPRDGPGRRSQAAPAPRSGHPVGSPYHAPPPHRHHQRSARALARACRMTRCCDGPFGAVRPLDAPS